MGSSPIFTEVIDVSLNTDTLVASLDQLISIYREKLQELSSTGMDSSALSGINVTAINADLASVRTELQALTTAFMESFGQVAAASSETGAATAQNLTKALDEVDAASAASVKKQLEDLSLLANGSEEAWSTFSAAATKALEDGFDPRIRTTADLTNNLFKLIGSGGMEAFDKLSAQQLDWYLGVKSTFEKVEELQGKAGTGSTEANIAKQRADQTALGNDIIAITKRERAEQEALGAEITASINRQRAEQVALGNDTVAIIARE
jgi:hypothetical protein